MPFIEEEYKINLWKNTDTKFDLDNQLWNNPDGVWLEETNDTE